MCVWERERERERERREREKGRERKKEKFVARERPRKKLYAFYKCILTLGIFSKTILNVTVYVSLILNIILFYPVNIWEVVNSWHLQKKKRKKKRKKEKKSELFEVISKYYSTITLSEKGIGYFILHISVLDGAPAVGIRRILFWHHYTPPHTHTVEISKNSNSFFFSVSTAWITRFSAKSGFSKCSLTFLFVSYRSMPMTRAFCQKCDRKRSSIPVCTYLDTKVRMHVYNNATPTPSADCDTRSIFKRDMLIWVFLLLFSYHTKVKEYILPYYFCIVGDGEREGFMP